MENKIQLFFQAGTASTLAMKKAAALKQKKISSPKIASPKISSPKIQSPKVLSPKVEPTSSTSTPKILSPKQNSSKADNVETTKTSRPSRVAAATPKVSIEFEKSCLDCFSIKHIFFRRLQMQIAEMKEKTSSPLL